MTLRQRFSNLVQRVSQTLRGSRTRTPDPAPDALSNANAIKAEGEPQVLKEREATAESAQLDPSSDQQRQSEPQEEVMEHQAGAQPEQEHILHAQEVPPRTASPSLDEQLPRIQFGPETSDDPGQVDNNVVEQVEDKIQFGVATANAVNNLFNPGTLAAIEDGINALSDSIPTLMIVLDQVANIHPFIQAAFLPFKVAWALEQKRQSNDKRILALFVEMCAMLKILTGLRKVKRHTLEQEISKQMEDISHRAGNDIRQCANACDAWFKKRLIVKLLNGPTWEQKLADFAGTFAQRQDEFQSVLAMHSALGINTANRTTREINSKVDMILKALAQMTRSETEIQMLRKANELISKKTSREVALKDETVLKELSNMETRYQTSSLEDRLPTSEVAKGGRPEEKLDQGNLSDLKNQLQLSPEAAWEANWKQFSIKFEFQQQQIVQKISQVVKEQGDRIMKAVTLEDLLKQITDPDIRAIWEQMGWRSSVKARHFVMAIRDYFQQQSKRAKQEMAQVDAAIKSDSSLIIEDEWALEFIDISHLQAISEAFDDDASGFVTLTEVNTFTGNQPTGWT
uniref:EF-hand domain-containing protein n=1 Tax=Mycena chlorophos TaxID=658473 RepID=A0ABQ0L1J0_MYCCL|nr:predicted protein [Mycena chlorophos]